MPQFKYLATVSCDAGNVAEAWMRMQIVVDALAREGIDLAVKGGVVYEDEDEEGDEGGGSGVREPRVPIPPDDTTGAIVDPEIEPEPVP